MDRREPADRPAAPSPRTRSNGRGNRSTHLAPKLGPALSALREARGLTQKQLAERAEIDPSTLSRLESGGRGASREVVDRLARALTASTEEHNKLLAAAGLLPENLAYLLGEPDLVRLSAVLSDPALTTYDRSTLLSYIQLALAHAEALGYAVPVRERERRSASA